MFVSHEQNVGQKHNLLTVKKSYKNLTNVKYFGITVTNLTSIIENI
jgi:hypothetical protein